jgi:hypothetical protein
MCCSSKQARHVVKVHTPALLLEKQQKLHVAVSVSLLLQPHLLVLYVLYQHRAAPLADVDGVLLLLLLLLLPLPLSLCRSGPC